MRNPSLRRVALLSATALASFSALPVHAQDTAAPAAAEEEVGDEIVVTATRRSTTLQNTPINITALSAQSLAEKRVDDVRGLADFTPGVTIQDSGPRGSGTIVARGLNADDNSSSGSNGATGTNGENGIATYLGETPLYLDFKFIDIDRVEVLLGPQGTLYGLGTLAGAVRYMPNRPNPNDWSADVHARGYGVAHSGSPGFQVDGAVNIPIIPGKLAFRSATGLYEDPGFIDYTTLVRQPGVSLAQPGGPVTPGLSMPAVTTSPALLGTAAQRAANLYTYKDANFEDTFSTRNQLGITPFDALKVYLTYAHQITNTNGRQANSAGVLGTGNYESAKRYLEPMNRKADLYSAEVELKLGNIAQIVSATAWSEQVIDQKNDNSDLLLDLDYDYELFPAFTSYNTSHVTRKQFNQEVRLVSTHGGPVSWVLGGFYNNFRYHSNYQEYIPGYSSYLTGGTGPGRRPDDLEYFSFVQNQTKEKAVFGEASLQITKAWQVTGGARYFKYEAFTSGGSDLPLTGGGVRRTPYPLMVFDPSRVRSAGTTDDGFVWKANTSYKFSPTLMVYGTYSTGYRIGGVNRVVPCPTVLAPGQNLCALPNELDYKPDKTTNKEIGIRATLFDGRLYGTLSGYHIDWDGIQLAGQTENGAIGITVNGGKAISKGIELAFTAKPIPRLTITGNYSYTDAHLTEDVPGLLQLRNPLYPDGGRVISVDAKSGDRLPGSAKNSGSVSANYKLPLGNGADTLFSWTASYRGNMLSRVGARAYGEVIPAYWVHRASVAYRKDNWELRVYADNIFDKYAVTGIDNDLSRQFLNDGVVSRYYGQGVLTPRKVGVEGSIHF